MFINPDIIERSTAYRQDFINAKPFKYVVIDNFFFSGIAKDILDNFPVFNKDKAISETGNIGGKAVNEDLKNMGHIFANLADYLESKDFLNIVTELTGIPDLINDRTFYGGGTHENLHGQELDPHVDFNIDERRWYHRRLNLLIYLNPEWQESWGGVLELHSDPRDRFNNKVTSILPIFNRCVIFETSEYSWHGFSKINLPEDKRHLSRKSLSIYLYTEDRPEEDKAPSHTTFYVHRHLPDTVQPDRVLSAGDYREIEILLKRRDDLIKYYQDRELRESTDIVSLKSHIKRYLSTRYPRIWKFLRRGTASIKG